MTGLATTEAARLHELEGVLKRGLRMFVDIGNALREIHDSRLYRERHDTFEGYCRERWGMERAHAYRQIEAAEVVGGLSPNGDIPRPANEAQARELTRLDDPGAREKAWQEAAKRAEQEERRVTASDVRAAVVARLPSPQPKSRQEPAKAPEPAEPERRDPEPEQAPPKAPSSPAEEIAHFSARCDNVPGRVESLPIEAVFVHAATEKAEEWVDSWSRARDALDAAIERAQTAIAGEPLAEDEMAEVEALARRAGVDLAGAGR